jgi:hypothetical protein
MRNVTSLALFLLAAVVLVAAFASIESQRNQQAKESGHRSSR